jgi:hypothetical protein
MAASRKDRPGFCRHAHGFPAKQGATKAQGGCRQGNANWDIHAASINGLLVFRLFQPRANRGKDCARRLAQSHSMAKKTNVARACHINKIMEANMLIKNIF